MPTRADHHTGQWTMSFMGWDALPDHAITLSQILGDQGVHTAAVIDTPFYTRGGMNYDRGFQPTTRARTRGLRHPCRTDRTPRVEGCRRRLRKEADVVLPAP